MKTPLTVRFSSLKQGENRLDFELEPDELGFSEREVRENPSFEQLVGPVQVKVRLVRTGQRLLVTGGVVFHARLDCALCGVEYDCDFDEPLSAEFVDSAVGVGQEQELDQEDLGRVELHGDVLDLGPLVRDAVHLAVPMAPVCRPDCKGLCDQCGANLNVSACSCRATPA